MEQGIARGTFKDSHCEHLEELLFELDQASTVGKMFESTFFMAANEASSTVDGGH